MRPKAFKRSERTEAPDVEKPSSAVLQDIPLLCLAGWIETTSYTNVFVSVSGAGVVVCASACESRSNRHTGNKLQRHILGKISKPVIPTLHVQNYADTPRYVPSLILGAPSFFAPKME
jgi:hypothetical protein